MVPVITRGTGRNMWEPPRGRSEDWGKPPSYGASA